MQASTDSKFLNGSEFNQAAVDERKRIREANAKRREEGLDALKSEGDGAFKSGDYKKAVSLYVSAIEKYGQKATLCSNLAAALSKLELWEDADRAATLALKANPRMNKARFRRAMARKALKRWEASMRDLEEIIALDPTCKEAISELVVVRPRFERWFENDEDDEDADSDYINPADVAYPSRNVYPFEYEPDSDTEDCRHKGNGVACRFYNHAGCSRGEECTFSHAPDDKSVRDRLGKNVCVHYLLNNCKYGDDNCIYSHDKRYLQADGWWTKPDSVGQAKIIFEETGALAGRVDTAEIFLHHLPIGRTIAKHALTALDNSRLQKAAQRAQDAKQSLPTAKAPRNFASTPPRQTPPNPKATPTISATQPDRSPAAVDTDRFILLISLDHEDWFNFTPLVRAIKEKRTVTQALRASEAIAKLGSPGLDGVIVTDAGIAKKRSSAVLNKLVEYVKAGGTAVIGCQFSNFIAGDNFEQFFNAFGLSWQRGSYHRTTHYLKGSNPVAGANPSLSPSYSMKALHADGIFDDQILYGPTRDSVTQSMVFAPRRVERFTEAPVVIAKVGKGYLGYVGDVNSEKESNNVYLAMLKILDGPTETAVPVASSSSSSAITQPSTSNVKTPTYEGTPPTSKTTVTTINSPRSPSTPAAVPKAQPSTSTFSPPLALSKDSPLIIALLGDSARAKFMKTFGKQVGQLERKTKVEIVTQRPILEQCLTSRSIRGIYVAGSEILSPDHASALLPLLASYVNNGGTVLAGGLFPANTNMPNFRSFFKTFGLTWEMGRSERAVYEVASNSELGKKNPELAEVYSMKAVSLKGVTSDVSLYTRLPDEDETDEDSAQPNAHFDSPVVSARVGRGLVGYVGDVNGEDETANVILAMFDLIHPDAPAPVQKRKSRPFALLFSFADESDTRQMCSGFLEGMEEGFEVLYSGLSTERMTDLIDSPDLKAIIVDSVEILSPGEAYLLSRIIAYVRSGGTVIFLEGFAEMITDAECRAFFMDNFGLDWAKHRDTYPLQPQDIVLNDFNMLVRNNEGKLPQSVQFPGVTFATNNPHHLVYIPKKTPRQDVWESKRGLYAGPCLHATVANSGKVGYVCRLGDSDDHYERIMRAMVGTL